MKILNSQPLLLLLLCFCHTSRSYSVDPGWAKKQADIFFCVDISSSVDALNLDYRKQLQFVADLVSRMDIGPSCTRVGVGLYSEDLYLYIPLNNTLSKDGLISAIMTAPHHGGNGYISRGLSGMMTKGLAPTLRRPDVPHISVLLTDDDARDMQIAMDNANLAKRQGIFLTTIAIGNRVNVARLGDYTSDPKSDFLYHVSNYNYLVSILPTVSKKLSEVEALAIDQGICGNAKFVDVVFVFDDAALGKKVSNKIKEFLQNITENLSLNSGKVRVGVVSKTHHDEGDITLVQNLKREQLIEKLKADKGEEIGYLIKITIRDSFTTENGARQGSLKRLVVFLDDNLRERREIYGQLAKAKRDQYEIFVFYLGASNDKPFIESLGTSKEHVIFLGSADELIPRKIDFTNIFCKNI